MSGKNFVCRYCSRPSTITNPNEFSHWEQIVINDPDIGHIGFSFEAFTCPNQECQKLTLRAFLTNWEENQATNWNIKPTKLIKEWNLLPASEAKVLPNYIPIPIQEDYKEACLIRDLSPKASATLARRCLQGMIRDFFGISLPKLKDEIDAIKDKIDPDTFEAIDSVRKVGNIGAHMEKDINVIVEVDQNEAQLLIELIEQLIEDWYVARKSKQDRLVKIKELAANKEQDKKK